MNQKIAIYGAGAIGGWMGAKLAAVGCNVSVVARGAALDALRAHGLRLREDDSPVQIEDVGIEHLGNTIEDVLASSRLISDAVADGRLAIVGANYRLSEGRAIPHVMVGLDA